MKTIIRFKYNESPVYPCRAVAEHAGRVFCAVGKTWDECEQDITATLKAALACGPVPAEKEIEI